MNLCLPGPIPMKYSPPAGLLTQQDRWPTSSRAHITSNTASAGRTFIIGALRFLRLPLLFTDMLYAVFQTEPITRSKRNSLVISVERCRKLRRKERKKETITTYDLWSFIIQYYLTFDLLLDKDSMSWISPKVCRWWHKMIDRQTERHWDLQT